MYCRRMGSIHNVFQSFVLIFPHLSVGMAKLLLYERQEVVGQQPGQLLGVQGAGVQDVGEAPVHLLPYVLPGVWGGNDLLLIKHY